MIAFQPATAPRDASAIRMLTVDRASGALGDHRLSGVAGLLAPEDLWVVNDAATLPASLLARAPDGAPIEVRLAEPIDAHGHARAVLFGPGSWRDRTEDRAPPQRYEAGTRLVLEDGVEADVAQVAPLSPRLVTLAFRGPIERALGALYAAGRPVQYAYLERELALWDVQTAYAARPWAVEAPSAGLGLTWSVLDQIRRRGVRIATVTHAAGLSSTGDPVIDAALPLEERSDVPRATTEAIARTRARKGRVIAVGTSVVRALEARGEALEPGERMVDLRLGPDSKLRVVDGILTGVHAPGESHHALLRAFLPEERLARAVEHAAELGYLNHELGDTMLVV